MTLKKSVCNSQGYIFFGDTRDVRVLPSRWQLTGIERLLENFGQMGANSHAASLRTLEEMRSGPHALVTAILSSCFLTPCREMCILGILSQGEIPGEGMDDKYSSADAVLNCSRRASALEESGVQILLFFGKGVGVGGGGTPIASDPKDCRWTQAF